MLTLSRVSRVRLCDPMDCSPPGFSVHGDSPGKNTGVGWHVFLQGIFPNQGSNPGLLHCKQTLYPLSYQGSSTPSIAFIICRFYDDGHLGQRKVHLIVILICVYLIISDAECPFTCLLAICMPSLERYLFRSSVHFLIVLLVFFILSSLSCRYISWRLTFCLLLHSQMFSLILRVVFSSSL